MSIVGLVVGIPDLPHTTSRDSALKGHCSGQGSGSVLEQEEDFVEENQSLIDGFRDDVASNLGTTINYDALAIEGSNIVFETLAKDVLVDHLETWIDFFVVEAPEGSP